MLGRRGLYSFVIKASNFVHEGFLLYLLVLLTFALGIYAILENGQKLQDPTA